MGSKKKVKVLPYYRRLLKTYFKTHAWGLFAIIIIAILFLGVSLFVAKDNLSTNFFQKPSVGIVFPFLLAVITMGGFLISLSKLEELLGRITSLKQFLDKANSLIEDALSTEEPLWIVCHSPYIGNLSERGTNPQKNFKKNLELLMRKKSCPTHIIGLCPTALKNYYRQFAKDDRYKNGEDTVMKSAFMEMKDLFALVTSKHSNIEYYGLNYQSPFFLVASKHEAVVASAFFLPTPISAEKNDQFVSDECGKSFGEKNCIAVEDASFEEENNVQMNNKVELLGFVTHDPYQITELLEAVDFLEKSGSKIGIQCGLDKIFTNELSQK